MKEICEKDRCTGCGACVNICPKNCISMVVGDSLGHVYPSVNSSICIDCGLCQKKCPSNYPLEKYMPLTAYAGWDKNIEEYKSSTSGGAASAISRYFIRQGGVVYGCSMMPGLEAGHIRVSTEEDLLKLKGSKYVQSNVGSAYKNAVADLKDGKKVLFIGTPCQTAAMKKLAGKNDDNLYTVDLICHGVPSQKFLRDHSKSKVGNVDDVVALFRGEEGMFLSLQRILPDGKTEDLYKRTLKYQRYADSYFNAFFDGYTYRRSCRTCSYACPERASDLTIGDFWKLGKKTPFPYEHPYGCSVLLPTTDKGRELVDAISPEFNLYEREVSEAVEGNDQLQHPFYISRRIALFMKLHKFIGIGNAYHLCVFDKMVKLKVRRLKGKLLGKK